MAPLRKHDWYLREWLDALQASQADLERLTGWDKRKTSHLVTCKQPYKRDTVNEAADALHIQPFELLMPPDEAFALRRFRESAVQLAASSQPEEPLPQIGPALGAAATPRKIG